MSGYPEKMAKAKTLAEKAKEAEKRGDWVDALVCWAVAHDLSIGDDFREWCWKEMSRVRQLAEKNPSKKEKPSETVGSV